MRVWQFCVSIDGADSGPTSVSRDADLVLVFGGGRALADWGRSGEPQRLFPRAAILGCTTAGEIIGDRILDNSLVVNAVHFEHTRVRAVAVPLATPAASYEAGRELATALRGPGLTHVFVVSEGISVEGSALCKGLAAALPHDVGISGGLAGDGERMQRTLVLCNETLAPNIVAAVGFYGTHLKVACGSRGGWDPFGPERRVTRSEGNIVYELDGGSALELYRRFLGPHADALPASGLLFPLEVRPAEGGQRVVRTILGIDERQGGIVFAGEVPEGHLGRLMRANFDRLIDGAAQAARVATHRLAVRPELSILVSCLGRRMLLKQRAEEEIEAVLRTTGHIPTAGFYANGEIAPVDDRGSVLHNQTMTITTLSET